MLAMKPWILESFSSPDRSEASRHAAAPRIPPRKRLRTDDYPIHDITFTATTMLQDQTSVAASFAEHVRNDNQVPRSIEIETKQASQDEPNNYDANTETDTQDFANYWSELTTANKHYTLSNTRQESIAHNRPTVSSASMIPLVNPFEGDVGRPRFPSQEQRRMIHDHRTGKGLVKLPPRTTSDTENSQRQLAEATNAKSSNSKRDRPHPTAQCEGILTVMGRTLQMCSADVNLLKFFRQPFCEGRTLLPEENFWRTNVIPMIGESKCVRHSLLAFASAYVLDFVPHQHFRNLANEHYQNAVEALDDMLRTPYTLSPGREECTIAALMLLIGIDVVRWELRYPPGQDPRWLKGLRTAKAIFDRSDPVYLDIIRQAPQYHQARTSYSTWIAYGNILADVAMPFSTEEDRAEYLWLVEGREQHAVRRISGGIGVSTKLLHTLDQITCLAKRLSSDPSDDPILKAIFRIEARLHKFCQWSDGARGPADFDFLIEDCRANLDKNTGRLDNGGRLVNLIGHAWVFSVQIYLQCRALRRPRGHPFVRGALHRLRQCIELMPFNGHLLTAQTPLFVMFIAALVAMNEDRGPIRQWFEGICSLECDRSNVPPLWASLQRIWQWMDSHVSNEVIFGEEVVTVKGQEKDLGSRLPWWEQMVDWTVKSEGVLSLV